MFFVMKCFGNNIRELCKQYCVSRWKNMGMSVSYVTYCNKTIYGKLILSALSCVCF
jgi:hypothetical protein